MANFLSPVGNSQQIDTNGNPLTYGQIYSYLAGSSTPTPTFTSKDGATQQANPITLNSLGIPDSPIWLAGGVAVKLVIKDSANVTLRTIDNVSGVNDTTSSPTEWVDSGLLPTYLSATSFSVEGDQTGVLQVSRRLRTQNTAGQSYSTITTSVYAIGITTVTVKNDSLALDAGLSTIAYGLLAPQNKSLAIVGIVSQIGGVPTGAVIERGSNASGSYVRFADGTQICHAYKVLSAAATFSFGAAFTLTAGLPFTFAKPFISDPDVSPSVYSPSGFAPSTVTISTTGMTIDLISLTSRTVDVGISYTAIGRWY